MTDITVRSLGEDDWQDYRSVRLAALRESPEAFVATVDEEEAFDDEPLARADAAVGPSRRRARR